MQREQTPLQRIAADFGQSRLALAGLAQGVDDLRSRVGDGQAA